MYLEIWSNGKTPSKFCEVHAEEDKQALLNRASLNAPGPLSSRMNLSNQTRRRSSAREENSLQPEQRYIQLKNGSHEHHLLSLSHRPNKYRKGSHSTIKGLDPDMNLPFETILAVSSLWIRKFKTPEHDDVQLLSTKYDHVADLLDNSQGDIKICMIQEKDRTTEGTCHSRPGKIFAVKIYVRPPQKEHKVYLRNVTAEFCVAHTLQHPNIVRVFELLHNEHGDLCQVMEYCDAGSLLDLLTQVDKLTKAEADCFFKQLLRGVQYIHSMGVAHRNLKPENILLTRQGILKITDFRCAECYRMPWASPLKANNMVDNRHHTWKGTIAFMAPEQFTESEFDPAAGDMWAVGIIYFTLRFGRLPWKSATKEDLLYRKYTKDMSAGRRNEYIELVSDVSKATSSRH